MDIREEIRKLKIAGVTIEQIRNELKWREVPEAELRYARVLNNVTPSEEESVLSVYSDRQLKRIEEEMAILLYDDYNALDEREEEPMKADILKNFEEKLEETKAVKTASANVYDEIKEKLASCKTTEDYISAYKWLAYRFVEINESAKEFENKFVSKYGEAGYGELVYGSKEAYEKEKAFEENLAKASPAEREMLFLKKLMNENNNTQQEENYPVLWPEDEEEEELLQAQ